MNYERELEALRPVALAYCKQKLNEDLRDAAEDVAQNAIIKAWEQKAGFDLSSGRAGLRALLIGCCESQCRAHITLSRRREKWLERPVYRESQGNVDPLDLVPSFIDVEEQAIANLEREEDRARLYTLIDTAGLSAREKQVVMLHLQNDLPLCDVANRLGLCDGAIRAYWFRALAKLKAAAEGDCVEKQ